MTSKFAVIAGLLVGSSLLLFWGGEAPGWLLRLECLSAMLAALVAGFGQLTVKLPVRLAHCLRHQTVRGVVVVYLGVGAMFIDPRVLISAFLIGSGLRLVMQAARPTASAADLAVRETSRAIVK